MYSRTRAALGAAMLGLILGLASGAAGAPVNVEFAAVIRDIRPGLEGSEGVGQEMLAELTALGIAVGTAVEGDLLYDDAAAPLSPGSYDSASLAFSFQAGDLFASLVPGGGTIFAVQLPAFGLVQLGGLLDLGPLAGQNRGGSLVLIADDLTDWTDGSLPSGTPDLDDLHPFDLSLYLDGDNLTYSTAFGFGFTRCVGPGEIPACQTISVLGEITRLETVPEPGLAALAAATALALAVRRRRR